VRGGGSWGPSTSKWKIFEEFHYLAPSYSFLVSLSLLDRETEGAVISGRGTEAVEDDSKKRLCIFKYMYIPSTSHVLTVFRY
jgi:hypothetical protein